MAGRAGVRKDRVNDFLKLSFTKFLIIYFLIILYGVSQAKSFDHPNNHPNFSHRLVFDSGVTISGDSVLGKMSGKTVELRLSRKFDILIKSYCYGNCGKEISYRKISLKSLKVRNKSRESGVRIDDPVIVVLNRLGFVKKIIILRIPE